MSQWIKPEGALRSVINIKGRTWGRLTAREFSHTEKDKGAVWIFDCLCGGSITFPAGRVKGGRKKSCGCLHEKEKKSTLEAAWSRRISNFRSAWATTKELGRSHVAWLANPASFIEWLKGEGVTHPFTPRWQLRRHDYDQGYTPENCFVVFIITPPITIEAWGEEKTIWAWSQDQRCSVYRNTLAARWDRRDDLYARGWGNEDIICRRTSRKGPIMGTKGYQKHIRSKRKKK